MKIECNNIKWYYLLPIIIFGFYSGVLWRVATPSYNVESSNEITTWTNGYLTNDTYLKCDIQRFVGENARPPQKDIYFWIINADSSSLVALKSKVSPGPRGSSFSQVLDVILYKESNWNIFPFTINIPKAKPFFEQNYSWTLLMEKEGWDTYYIKFQRETGGREHVFEWYLDRDTHLTEKIRVIHHNPDTSDTKMILKVKGSSVGIVDDDETKLIGLFCSYSALFLLPFSFIVALYKNIELNPVQSEKKRVQSREYKKDYMKKYKENQELS
ncbi:MAG: hypothetical protein GWO20_16600 [Candidatus Korarchaeota archaeon]|nr:hypothetical protein [Candidatus Korarchaeota archaeon]NIU85025.1 hypothetical protein [Candidatus Thorarchaeota archaeon]NIW15050.1 hypothetical protein [Candidatus Thorarchaeota archaeon]NIW53060.1 hypothetical protein [Candidatus Korarchaeota archaeon]